MTDLNTLLRSRAAPPDNPGLAARIAEHAARTPQRGRMSLRKIVSFRLRAAVTGGAHLKPAYAYACALMLGLFIGIGVPDGSAGGRDDNPFANEETLL